MRNMQIMHPKSLTYSLDFILFTAVHWILNKHNFIFILDTFFVEFLV